MSTLPTAQRGTACFIFLLQFLIYEMEMLYLYVSVLLLLEQLRKLELCWSLVSGHLSVVCNAVLYTYRGV